LHLAALLGTESTVRYLVKHGARLDAKNKQGRTPIEEIVQAPRKDKGHSLLADKPSEEGLPAPPPTQSPATVRMVKVLQELMGTATAANVAARND
jgi:ankyrin repeat protein